MKMAPKMAPIMVWILFAHRLSPIHVSEPQHMSLAASKVSEWVGRGGLDANVYLPLYRRHVLSTL